MRHALSVLLLALGGCALDDGCVDRVLEAKPDLEGPLIAWRYLRDCGATVEPSMNIAVGRRDSGLAGATRVFTADTNAAARAAAKQRAAQPDGTLIRSSEDALNDSVEMDGLIDDGPNLWVEMQWTQPHRLSVAYAKRARVFRSVTRAGAAAIVYRESSRNVMPPLVPTYHPMPAVTD